MLKRKWALGPIACLLVVVGLAGCSAAAAGPANYIYDTAKMSDSANMAKYNWYSVDKGAGTIAVTLPAEKGYEYGCNVFNEDVMEVASENVDGDAYKVTLEKLAPGKTSLNFFGYTADTGRNDYTAVLEVDISNSGEITVYYTGNDFHYDPERFDCIPVAPANGDDGSGTASTDDRKMW